MILGRYPMKVVREKITAFVMSSYDGSYGKYTFLYLTLD